MRTASALRVSLLEPVVKSGGIRDAEIEYWRVALKLASVNYEFRARALLTRGRVTTPFNGSGQTRFALQMSVGVKSRG